MTIPATAGMVFCYMHEMVCIAVNLHIIKTENMPEKTGINRGSNNPPTWGTYRRGHE